MSGPHFGAGHGQFSVSGSPVPLINGLTVSQLVTVYNPSFSGGNIYLHDSRFDYTSGYVLEPGNQVVVDTNNSLSTWYVSTDGVTPSTVSWVSSRLSY